MALSSHPTAAEQFVANGKNAAAWSLLSCPRFAANGSFAAIGRVADNLANFIHTMSLPEGAKE